MNFVPFRYWKIGKTTLDLYQNLLNNLERQIFKFVRIKQPPSIEFRLYSFIIRFILESYIVISLYKMIFILVESIILFNVNGL